jgi:predicted Zn-ribbon and HTH transcriptional regulator
VRQRLLRLLRESDHDRRSLSQALGVPERELEAHLAHVRRSLAAAGRRLQVKPAECLACGFIFEDRRRFKRPGRCPRCRQTRLSYPVFRIH